MIANQLFYRVAERAHDHRRRRQHPEAHAVRRAGDSHVLRLARGRHRAVAAAGRIDPRRRHGDPAADCRQQDHQHDHHPRHRAGGADCRARHRGQRQAARRSDGRRADSRSQPRARQAATASIWAATRRRWRSRPESAPGADAAPFNLNTISQGVSTADFYLSVPSAVVRFLESDSQTKVLAKPNLRGVEGQKLSLNLGEDVPVPSTTFTPLAGPAASASSPLTSFGYRTDRHHRRHDAARHLRRRHHSRDHGREQRARPGHQHRRPEPAVVLLAQGATKLRLRDGESNLLAGLLREDERRSLKGFPGIMRLPIVRQLFSANDNNIKQTDIVMLLTPRIIRTHDLQRAGPEPDLHRHAEQHGVDRSAGDDWRPGARARARRHRRQPTPPAPVATGAPTSPAP